MTYGGVPAEAQDASQLVPMPMSAPVMYEYTPAQAQYLQPPVYNISPERFSQIAAGIPLTQEEIDSMTGASAAPEALVPQAPAPQASVPQASVPQVPATSSEIADAGTPGAAAEVVAAPAAVAKEKKTSKKKGLKNS